MKALPALPALALLAVLARPASAQGVITGTIKDARGHAVKGATISVESRDNPASLAATSDKKGRFAIQPLAPGEWYLIVQAPGYESVEQRVLVASAQRNVKYDVRLASSAVPSSLNGLSGRQVQQRIDAAAALAARGEIDGAIAAYTELVSRVPALTSVYLQIGALQERKNDRIAALAAYRRLLELEPENAKAREAVERLARRTQSK